MRCLVCNEEVKIIEENKIQKIVHCPKCKRNFPVFKNRQHIDYSKRG